MTARLAKEMYGPDGPSFAVANAPHPELRDTFPRGKAEARFIDLPKSFTTNTKGNWESPSCGLTLDGGNDMIFENRGAVRFAGRRRVQHKVG